MGLEVTCFLRGLAENSEEEGKKVASPETPAEELWEWVKWKAQAYEIPSWWKELMKIPEVEDCERLAKEVWASFHLPKMVSKLHQVENYHQAPPAMPSPEELPATAWLHLCLSRYLRNPM